MAPLRYAAKLRTPPSTLVQSKERKGSNFAIWQPCTAAADSEPFHPIGNKNTLSLPHFPSSFPFSLLFLHFFRAMWRATHYSTCRMLRLSREEAKSDTLTRCFSTNCSRHDPLECPTKLSHYPMISVVRECEHRACKMAENVHLSFSPPFLPSFFLTQKGRRTARAMPWEAKNKACCGFGNAQSLMLNMSQHTRMVLHQARMIFPF